ncbi:hypothetical protein G6F56_007646 [Rhizopus delemar]|nr:hypothetical protein G6F56_007646 [Rhizopus delemar]
MQDKFVKLNIGGKAFITSKATLEEISFFWEMFVKDQQTLKKKEEIFIDRDGTLFEHILDFLQIGNLDSISTDTCLLQRLQVEEEFYKIPALEKEIKQKLAKNHRVRHVLMNIQELKNWKCKKLEFRTYDFPSGEGELVGAFEYVQNKWICPRNIYVHQSRRDCGKNCFKKHVPFIHGWQITNVTVFLVAFKE